MYAHLDGIVAEKGRDYLVIDCAGVGYLTSVSGATLAAAPAVGGRMKVYTVLNVREDAMELTAFATKEEKRMYERLRAVNGIGSRTALSILSALTLRDLSIALVTGDANLLTRVPGIGKKTAQRLVLELRDKVEDEELTGSGAAPTAARPQGGISGEAIEALMSLGYQASEAARAVSAYEDKAATVEELVGLALRGMNA